jgi:hypothetical protein
MGVIEDHVLPYKDEPSIATWAVLVLHERFPEAETISIDEVEITGDSAYVAATVKMPPQHPTLIEIKIVEQKPE